MPAKKLPAILSLRASYLLKGHPLDSEESSGRRG
jgi:hypothetical protein